MKITQILKPFEQVIGHTRISKTLLSLFPILGGT
jgi:hypothetical protein